MDEVLREEACVAGTLTAVHGIPGILAALLVLVLAVNPAIREMVGGFIHAPIVPSAMAESIAESKTKEETGKREKAIVADGMKLALKDPASVGEPMTDHLLREVVLPEVPLSLPKVADGLGESVPEMVEQVAWNPVVPEIEPDMSAIPEIEQDAPIISNPVEPEKLVSEKMPEAPVKTEVTVPGTEISETEIPGTEIASVDPVNTEAAVPITPTDTIITENPSEDPMAAEVITPGSLEADPIVPETPNPAVPDAGEGNVEAAEEIPSNPAKEDGGTAETVSCFLLDDAGMLYGFLPEYAEIPDGCLELPEECTGIRSGAFAGCGAEILELYIPAGAANIEEGALVGLSYLEWIDVEDGNPGCASDSGVLFDSSMSVLLAFPSAWLEGYSVPAGVTRIASRAFEGASITKLDVRECPGLSFAGDAFGYSGGSGIQIVGLE